jgi:hypothetical protein
MSYFMHAADDFEQWVLIRTYHTSSADIFITHAQQSPYDECLDFDITRTTNFRLQLFIILICENSVFFGNPLPVQRSRAVYYA